MIAAVLLESPVPVLTKGFSMLLLRSSWLVLTVALCGCVATSKEEPVSSAFRHDFTTRTVPWTQARFDDQEDKFTFAVFSDLTGGEREGVFEIAVEQLNLLRPELIVSVGDLIEGGTDDRAQLDREWASFDQRANRALAPMFRVPGNHDLTHPVMWEVWEERYGRRYYHFVYKDVLFLVLDTEDNSPEEQIRIHEIRQEALRVIEAEGWGAFDRTEYAHLTDRKVGRVSPSQAAYFRQAIDENPQVRWTFLLMHKPAWERPDEENFSSIEDALADRAYTVFFGHEHAYLHQRRRNRDYIRLGTTGGVQNVAKTMAVDHVTLVTVSGEAVDIANIRMSGIFDKNGMIPLNGEELCFEAVVCGPETD
jgi:hypothetical protein